MGCEHALNYLEDMSLHAARGGEHVTIELSCRTCPYTPRGVAGKQGSHGKEHETEKENNNKITNEIDIEKGNILIALQNMPLHAARGGGHIETKHVWQWLEIGGSKSRQDTTGRSVLDTHTYYIESLRSKTAIDR